MDLDSFPKAVVEIYINALEVDGDPFSVALMCASLALTDAGISIYGLLGCACIVCALLCLRQHSISCIECNEGQFNRFESHDRRAEQLQVLHYNCHYEFHQGRSSVGMVCLFYRKLSTSLTAERLLLKSVQW